MKNLIKNHYLISTIKKILTILLGVVATSLLTRYLGPEGQGRYSYITSIINILAVVFNLGLNLSYTKYRRDKSKDYLSIFFSLSTILFIFIIVLGIGIYAITRDINSFIIIILTGLSVYRIQTSQYVLVEEFVANSIIHIISNTVNTILIVVVYFTLEKYVLLAFMLFGFKNFTNIILSIYILFKRHKIRLNLSVDPEVFIYGLKVLVTMILIDINYRVDILILERMNIDFALIGFYSVGVALAEYGWLIPDIFKDVLMNKLAKKDDFQSVSFSLRISSTMMIAIFILLAVFGQLVIKLLFGDAFINSYLITMIIFLGTYGILYVKIIGTLYYAKGKIRFYTISLFIAVMLNVILNILLIPIWSIYGAAFSTVVSYTVVGLLFLFDFSKQYRVSIRNLIFINKNDLNKLINIIQSKNI